MSHSHDTQEYLSKEKCEQLQQELKLLETETRREVAAQLEYAKSFGDLSENAEYHEARERQADIEDRIKELKVILKNAVVVSGHSGSTVNIGSRVTVKKTGGATVDYTLVGAEEADLDQGKISYQSPIGTALLGRQSGEAVTVKTPRGEIHYKILAIK